MSKINVLARLRTLLGMANTPEKLDLSGSSCGFADGDPCAACNEITALDNKIEVAASTLQNLIVEATPKLWTELSIDFHRSDGEPYINFIDGWLSRSGGLGLRLAVYESVSRAWITVAKAELQSKIQATSACLVELVNAHAPRWKNLDIRVSKDFLRQFQCPPSQELVLESLRMRTLVHDSNDEDLVFCIQTDTDYTLRPKDSKRTLAVSQRLTASPFSPLL
ncbi:unnamed protein product [Cyclocybe aegerita]|uniref:Uncharacterized protein n=1 Tax=Cyclocybe aegerita TaxID=1973307 RepID=A0A8S0WCM6_CYCAE|nr:unnamed protein product [Cyclocybe aegerita]